MAFHRPGNEFPHQVSSDQASKGKSKFVFSNGASFPAHRNEYSMNSDTDFVRDGFVNTSEKDLPRLPSPHCGVTGATVRLTHQPRHPMYAVYGERLRSFARWTRTNPDPVSLCDAGFFFTNEGGLVRCFSCGIGLNDFTARDDPLKEHVRHSKNCLYLLEHLGTATLVFIRASSQEQQGIQGNSATQCRHPEYQSYESRLSTFTGWPSHLCQTPESLADAGLFYIGVEDLVRCFSCDGVLRGWDAEEIPWTEHCRWFPTCLYARERKGETFIALVIASSAHSRQRSTNTKENVGSEDLHGAMYRMTLTDPELRAELEKHKTMCLEMGYDFADVDKAVYDLRNMVTGTITPTIGELIDMVEVVKERNQRKVMIKPLDKRHQETPFEENERVKSCVTSMTCGKKHVDCFFLPALITKYAWSSLRISLSALCVTDRFDRR